MFAEPLVPFRDRTGANAQRIDHDMQKKRDADREWEDWTDGAFLPLPQSSAGRHWRVGDQSTIFQPDGSKDVLTTFQTSNHLAIGGSRPAFRKRVGRGGRVMLDRVLPRTVAPVDAADPDRAERLASRWRFDSDATMDLPSHEGTTVVDDYALPYALARIELVKDDLPSLASSSAFVYQVASPWLARPPDTPPRNQIIGRMPVRPPPPQQQQMLAQQHHPAMAAAIAAQRAGLAKAQAQMLPPSGPAPPQLRRSNSGSQQPIGTGPGGLPMNGAQWPQPKPGQPQYPVR